MREKNEITDKVKALKTEVDEFRIIEEITEDLAKKDYCVDVILSEISSNYLQRLGYISDVANLLNKDLGKTNDALTELNNELNMWLGYNSNELKEIYFTKNHIVKNFLSSNEMTLELSKKWKVISSFSHKDFGNKYKQRST